MGNGRVFFVANAGNGQGFEPFVSDGTAAGTISVGDLHPGTASSGIRNIQVAGSKAYFDANDGVNGTELWCSDGTVSGTHIVIDLTPGATSSSLGERAAAANGALLFIASTPATGRELWITDGAPATTRVIDLVPGTISSNPLGLRATDLGVLFRATAQGLGSEVWTSDGTIAGTTVLVDTNPGSGGSNPSNFAPFGSSALFVASTNHGPELWITDGSPSGTREVRDIAQPASNSNPTDILEIGTSGIAAFVATADTTGTDLWITNGTSTGTTPIDVTPGVGGSNVTDPIIWNGDLWFGARASPTAGIELFRSNGTVGGTGLVADVAPGPASSSPRRLAVGANGLMFFQANANGLGLGLEPYVSDGTAAGTSLLRDINIGPAGSVGQSEFVTAGNQTFFVAIEASIGAELWVSDGSTAGTQNVIDIQPGTQSSNVRDLTAAGARAYFTASSPSTGREIWSSDGTAAGTAVILDLQPGLASSSPANLTAGSTLLYFTATTTATGHELWVTDGTANGTVRISDIVAGPGRPTFRDFITVGDTLFFIADDRTNGFELWTSDGTLASTRMVRDIFPGVESGIPTVGTLSRGGPNSVLFAATDGGDGLQVWSSDGTSAGTQQVGRIGSASGSGAARIGSFVTAGPNILFPADDGITGIELWVISTAGPLAYTQPYGLACRGTNQRSPTIGAIGAPILGGSFDITVDNALPSTPAALQWSTRQSNVQVFGCRLLMQAPILPLGSAMTDVAGRATRTLAVPNDPTLAGFRLYAQWFALDPGGPVFGVATFSDGLLIQLGN